MKKLLIVLLILAMVFSMVACGGKKDEPQTTPLTPEEAWKLEPAYGKTLHYWTGDSCTAATNLADALGFFAEEGLTVEGFLGSSDVEAIGTQQVDIAIGHIAKAAVPATNGVNLTFVGGAHLLTGCKAMYVLADSPYQTYDDLKGKAISVPNGIGASDYNITARLLLEAGIDPLTEVTLTPVAKDACVSAMERGEIAAALLGETFGWK
ncbi:MAG: ABC transporter substrate-binding protein, partial [Clostridia bacterium]|nr:ABC transporter substrate-binding protein [Clostridia bacterium]